MQLAVTVFFYSLDESSVKEIYPVFELSDLAMVRKVQAMPDPLFDYVRPTERPGIGSEFSALPQGHSATAAWWQAAILSVARGPQRAHGMRLQ